MKNKGKEFSLLRDLCDKYKVPAEPELTAFAAKLKELKLAAGASPEQASLINGQPAAGLISGIGASPSKKQPPPGSGSGSGSGVSGGISISTDFELGRAVPIAARGAGAGAGGPGPGPGTGTGPGTPSGGTLGGMDSSTVQAMLNECRVKYEAQLEEERAVGRKALAEREGHLTRKDAELEALKRQLLTMEQDLKTLNDYVDRSKESGGKASQRAEEDLLQLQKEMASVRSELAAATQDVFALREKNMSLESTMAQLSLGHEDMVKREQDMADERAAQQREREMAHMTQLQQVQEAAKNAEQKIKAELLQCKTDWSLQERELRAINDSTRRAKEVEVEALNRDMAERKAKLAEEVAASKLETDDARKRADDASARADQAENVLRSMQAEILEARKCMQFNAQLHKDLQREQLARKRLHNEMEDMKVGWGWWVGSRSGSRVQGHLRYCALCSVLCTLCSGSVYGGDWHTLSCSIPNPEPPPLHSFPHSPPLSSSLPLSLPLSSSLYLSLPLSTSLFLSSSTGKNPRLRPRAAHVQDGTGAPMRRSRGTGWQAVRRRPPARRQKDV